MDKEFIENPVEAYEKLKTERKNLKWDLENNIQVKNHAMEEINQLKAEKEKIEMCLKEQNRLVVGMTKEIETLTFKKYDLLQTLTEIKEFVENEMTPNCDTKIILQKISKCEI